MFKSFNGSSWGPCAIMAAAGIIVGYGTASSAEADIVRSTFQAGAADAEVREEQSVSDQANGTTTVRGDNAELATRRGSGTTTTNQNSVMLMRFDISGITLADLAANPLVSLRLHVNSTSWTPARSNSVPSAPETGVQYGLSYYALNTTAPNQNWNESTVRYLDAPGLAYDANGATRDYDASTTTYLGDRDFAPFDPSSNRLVGEAIDLQNAALYSFLEAAITSNAPTVTFLVGVQEDSNIAYNYVFASNDTATLATQAASPNSGASNANGEFAPKLILTAVPEPTGAVAVVASAAAGLLCGARRRARR